ncbi:MAG: hypothetical protein QXX08_02970 [Candidatus Bathyarchaeia archaeon]
MVLKEGALAKQVIPTVLDQKRVYVMGEEEAYITWGNKCGFKGFKDGEYIR